MCIVLSSWTISILQTHQHPNAAIKLTWFPGPKLSNRVTAVLDPKAHSCTESFNKEVQICLKDKSDLSRNYIFYKIGMYVNAHMAK